MSPVKKIRSSGESEEDSRGRGGELLLEKIIDDEGEVSLIEQLREVNKKHVSIEVFFPS